jgi:pilus assembly protein CpaE
MYDYIIVDTTSYLSDVVLTALNHADVLVLVTSQDIPSIKNLSMFLSLADVSGISRDQILLIMNRYDKRIGITPERIGENLKQEVVLNIAQDERLVITGSINKGVPLVIENKNHPLSRGVVELANRVTERISQVINPDD